MSGDKSLEPTPHRRQQARQEGHVAKSQDLGSAAMLLLGVGVVMMLGGGLVGFLVNYCRSQLGGQPVLTVNAESVASQWNATLWALGRYLLPILGLLCLAGVAVNVLQTGFLFLPQKLSFDLSRISPIRGWQRIFSAGGMVHLGFGMFKLIVVFTVAGAVLYNQREALLGLVALAAAGARRANDADHSLDRDEDRRGPAGSGDSRLRLSAMALRAGSEDDAAGVARGVERTSKAIRSLIARRKQAQRSLAVGRVSSVSAPTVETQADGLKRAP